MDRENLRILRFTSVTPTLSMSRKNPTTVTVTASNVVKNVAYQWQSSTNLTTWASLSTSIPSATGSEALDVTTTQMLRCFYRVREQ